MRRIITALLAVLLLSAAAVGVSAVSVTELESYSTVSQDSKCQVTLIASVHVDRVTEGLTFPVPGQATAVTVNGSRVAAKKSDNVRLVKLDKVLDGMTGDFKLTINYTLPDVVHTNEIGGLELQIPLLAGFAYPIEVMNFSVTLPAKADGLPAFESGYHQANIERDISYHISGATINGSFTEALKDHETVVMRLAVDDKMFPQGLADIQDFTFGLVAMGICGGLALLYWLAGLRFWPLRRIRTTHPPYGYTAGEMGSILRLEGVDLHLTVLTWAQLGYILIQTDRHGKVVLHKRMEMGNERKEAEQQLFKKLFGRRNVVDTASHAYAVLCRTAAGKPMGIRELIHPHSASGRIFRVLASGIGLFGGVCLAIAISSGALLQGFMIFLMGVLGGISGWYIQEIGNCLVPIKRTKLIVYLSLCGVWLLLGLISGAFQVAAWMVAGLLVAGVLQAVGGRRTAQGRELYGQVFGLRRHLRRADQAQLQSLCAQDPDYFFAVAPYAMALGVGKAFAKRFGGIRLSGCPYLTSGMDAHMTASEWMTRMERTVESMDERVKKLPFEKLMAFLAGLRK